MLRLTRLPTLLLALNWLALVSAFALTCKAQGNVLWWLRLDWSGWLGEFSAMTELDMLPAGSVWMAWLVASVVWALASVLAARARATAGRAAQTLPPVASTAQAARRQLGGVSDMMQSRPELKEKILKLHQSLEKL
ncbi:MAG: hypothetical protein NBV65_05050 [Burkholderiaceae bacterium]|nr:hypothetical protein [Burkholderiaceae bacterium]